MTTFNKLTVQKSNAKRGQSAESIDLLSKSVISIDGGTYRRLNVATKANEICAIRIGSETYHHILIEPETVSIDDIAETDALRTAYEEYLQDSIDRLANA